MQERVAWGDGVQHCLMQAAVGGVLGPDKGGGDIWFRDTLSVTSTPRRCQSGVIGRQTQTDTPKMITLPAAMISRPASDVHDQVLRRPPSWVRGLKETDVHRVARRISSRDSRRQQPLVSVRG